MLPQDLDYRYLVGHGEMPVKYQEALSRNAEGSSIDTLADAGRTLKYRRQDLKEKLLNM